MSQDLLKAQKLEDKKLAFDLRRQGWSYSEIQKRVRAPKSTLSLWLRGVKLSRNQRRHLKQKRLEGSRRGLEKRINGLALQAEGTMSSARKDIKKISRRELWLLGVMLYWRERLAGGGSPEDFRGGVRFSSSDPSLVKLFVRWLKDIGGLKSEEMSFDLFIPKSKRKSALKVKEFWSRVTGSKQLPKTAHVYFQKIRPKRTGRKTSKAPYGILRVRVKASSMLARQIAGWTEGIKREISNY